MIYNNIDLKIFEELKPYGVQRYLNVKHNLDGYRRQITFTQKIITSLRWDVIKKGISPVKLGYTKNGNLRLDFSKEPENSLIVIGDLSLIVPVTKCTLHKSHVYYIIEDGGVFLEDDGEFITIKEFKNGRVNTVKSVNGLSSLPEVIWVSDDGCRLSRNPERNPSLFHTAMMDRIHLSMDFDSVNVTDWVNLDVLKELAQSNLITNAVISFITRYLSENTDKYFQIKEIIGHNLFMKVLRDLILPSYKITKTAINSFVAHLYDERYKQITSEDEIRKIESDVKSVINNADDVVLMYENAWNRYYFVIHLIPSKYITMKYLIRSRFLKFDYLVKSIPGVKEYIKNITTDDIKQSVEQIPNDLDDIVQLINEAGRELTEEEMMILVSADKVKHHSTPAFVATEFWGEEDVVFGCGNDLPRKDHTVIGNILKPTQKVIDYVKENQPEYAIYINQ